MAEIFEGLTRFFQEYVWGALIFTCVYSAVAGWLARMAVEAAQEEETREWLEEEVNRGWLEK